MPTDDFEAKGNGSLECIWHEIHLNQRASIKTLLHHNVTLQGPGSHSPSGRIDISLLMKGEIELSFPTVALCENSTRNLFTKADVENFDHAEAENEIFLLFP